MNAGTGEDVERECEDEKQIIMAHRTHGGWGGREERGEGAQRSPNKALSKAFLWLIWAPSPLLPPPQPP